jgi:hypothetical protein
MQLDRVHTCTYPHAAHRWQGNHNLLRIPTPLMSYLAIEGCHAFVTGALGGIGSAIVEELLGIATCGT